MGIFLCIIPNPPFLAIAIAILDSVTVSIAADKIGTFNCSLSVNITDMSVSLGKTSDFAGVSRTSSKVKPITLLILSILSPSYISKNLKSATFNTMFLSLFNKESLFSLTFSFLSITITLSKNIVMVSLIAAMLLRSSV